MGMRPISANPSSPVTHPKIPSGAEVEDTSDDDDMSLLLVERDDTNLTGRTSVTDQQTAQEITQVMASDDADNDGLALVDKTQHRVPDDITETLAPTQTSSTATNGDCDRDAGYPGHHHANGNHFDAYLCAG